MTDGPRVRRGARARGGCARAVPALLAGVLLSACRPGTPPAPAIELSACRLTGLAQELRCGEVDVAEDPDAPAGRRLRIHFAVVPALAKNKAPDPVFVLAGGPGQSATQVAPLTMPILTQLNARRDIVFVDQRGTGKSNPLECRDEPARATLAESFDLQRQIGRLGECLRTLQADPRHYATWIAMRDLDAVREALRAEQVNLWGASYGTRAALEYMRQFPARVRTAILDGVAPPDMALPASFAVDGQAALDHVLAACAADRACSTRYPRFAGQVDRLLSRFGAAAAPARVTVAHPLTGRPEALPLTRDSVQAALRTPLYAPQLAALLPYAVERADQGDFGPFAALLGSFAGNDALRLAWGMHFAVICAEDLPRIDGEARRAAQSSRFGANFLELYGSACRVVPHRPPPPEFYTLPATPAPVLVLSGGADPATPPRHGERVARALPHARHLVAPNLGHGVSAHGCAPETISRFVRQATFDGIDGTCLQRIPAPPFFQPLDAPS
jgi:pimeloyl-ACP methyl ester carboxylesterase